MRRRGRRRTGDADDTAGGFSLDKRRGREREELDESWDQPRERKDIV